MPLGRISRCQTMKARRSPYLLRRLLRSEGYSPLWIFGVRTWPFGAHCWLQVDDLVIGDTLDRVRFYTPIMAA